MTISVAHPGLNDKQHNAGLDEVIVVQIDVELSLTPPYSFNKL